MEIEIMKLTIADGYKSEIYMPSQEPKIRNDEHILTESSTRIDRSKSKKFKEK